jgi:hypothetical protein
MSQVALASLIGSLAAMWIYANSVQQGHCLENRVLLASSTFMALVAFIFNMFWAFGFDIECAILTLASFLIACTAFLARRFHHAKGSTQDSAKRLQGLSLFTVLMPAFLMYLYPSLPALLPLGSNVDGGYHLGTVNVVLRALESSTNPQMFVVNNFGFHVNVGFIARALGTPVELTIYPFVSLIAALLVYCCYALIRNVVSFGRSCAALACFLLATSNPIVNLVAIDASWAVLLSLLMTSTALLVLSQRERSLTSRIILVAPIVVGTTFVYALFGGVILLLSFLFVALERPGIKWSVVSMGIAIISTGLSYLLFIDKAVWESATALMQYAVLPGVTQYSYVKSIGVVPRYFYVEWIGVVPLLLSLLALRRSTFRRLPAAFVFALAAGLYAILFIVLSSTLNPKTYFPYFLFKMSYLLPLPLAVLSGLALDRILQTVLRSPRPPRLRLKVAALWAASVLLVILIVSGSCTEAYLHLTNARYSGTGLIANPPIPISYEQYKTAIWVRDSIRQPITLSGDSPSAIYFWGIISSDWYTLSGLDGFENRYAQPDWWMRSAVSLDDWNASAASGDIIVSLRREDFWNFYFSHHPQTAFTLNYSSAHVEIHNETVCLSWTIYDNMIEQGSSAMHSVPTLYLDVHGLMPRRVELTDSRGTQVSYVRHSYSGSVLTFLEEPEGGTERPLGRIINATALATIRIFAAATANDLGNTSGVIALTVLSPREVYGYTILFENSATIVVQKNSN